MIVALGESNEGCEHYRMEFIENDDNIEVKILSTDPAEVKLLRNHLFINTGEEASSLLNFDENNKATINKASVLNFDGQLFVDFSKGEPWVPRQFKLAETRMVAEYNDTKTSYRHEHSDAHEHEHKHKPRSRIDGHTHFVAAFPMKNAMEKVLEEKNFYIPSLVVLKILKNKGINRPELTTYLKDNKLLPTDKSLFRQKDMSGDLIKEDFAIDIPLLSDDEKSFCLEGNTAYYLSVDKLKKQLTSDEWGDFCNGFDLPATHACDFTEHMENVYNLRNWFGKDTTFLKAQLETIYQEYEKQGIGYAEIPAGFLKKQEDLDKFIAISEEIETKRAVDEKEPIIIRPGLSIARLLEPGAFRSALFSFIPIILKNPSLASISILAHETNPTTEHLAAIKDFTEIINRNRPGFTIEVHAGETAAYGEVNISEARNLAINNPLIYIRAGHATYGNHKEKALDNFIEEKCPISNLTLIDVEPEVQVDVLEGIIAGNTNMFWGSDGAIYDPLYSPVEQEKFYMKLMSHPAILKELENRFKSNFPQGYSSEDFEQYMTNTRTELQQQFDRNKDNEAKYIHFKAVEKLFHGLKNDILKIETLIENNKLFDPRINIERLDDEFLSVINTFNQINSQIKNNLSINELRNTLTTKEVSLKTLRDEIDIVFQEIKSVNSELINAVMKDIDPILSDAYDKKSNEIVYYANMYNKLYKLFDAGGIDVLLNHPFLKDDVNFFKTTKKPSLQDIKLFIQQYLSKPVAAEFGLSVLCGNDNNECKAPVRKLYELCLPLYTAYKASREPDANVFSPRHHQKIADIFSKLDVETREKIRAIPPLKTSDHENLAMIINPSFQYNILLKRANERNNTSLNNYKEKNNFNASEDTIVLFGNPEKTTGIGQEDYMKNLYNFIYMQLKNHSQIILLGNLTEGINPLIYQIIQDYPDMVKGKNIVHIIANDENINTMRKDIKKEDFEPFYLTNKPRQEAHVGYANFLQEHNVSNIIMIGGKAAIWSDTKNALAERVINEKIGSEMIQFYSDGFGTTRSSSAYAKSYVNQRLNYSDNDIFYKNDFNALDDKYYDGNIKHSVNHRNLAFFYFACSDFLIELDYQSKLNDNFTLRQFFSVLDPTPQGSLSDTDIDADKLIDLTNQLDDYFQEFLKDSEPEIVSTFKSMLVHYGVDNLFKMNLVVTYGILNEQEAPSLKVS